MRVLVFNAGSFSMKLGVFYGEQQVLKAGFDRFSPEGRDLKIGGETRRAPQPDLAGAMAAVPALLDRHGVEKIDAVGHRLAHGETAFRPGAD